MIYSICITSNIVVRSCWWLSIQVRNLCIQLCHSTVVDKFSHHGQEYGSLIFQNSRYLKIHHFSWPWACQFNQSWVVVDIISEGVKSARLVGESEAVKGPGRKWVDSPPSEPNHTDNINNKPKIDWIRTPKAKGNDGSLNIWSFKILRSHISCLGSRMG